MNKINKKGETPLYWACKNNNFELVKILIKYGAKKSINTINCSPLLAAYENENKQIMKYLLENGADINQKVDKDGYSIIRYACIDQNIRMVKFIIENGCDMYRQDSYGGIPFFYALGAGKIDIINLFIKYGVDINQEVAMDMTHVFSSELKSSFAINFFISNEADIGKEVI